MEPGGLQKTRWKRPYPPLPLPSPRTGTDPPSSPRRPAPKRSSTHPSSCSETRSPTRSSGHTRKSAAHPPRLLSRNRRMSGLPRTPLSPSTLNRRIFSLTQMRWTNRVKWEVSVGTSISRHLTLWARTSWSGRSGRSAGFGAGSGGAWSPSWSPHWPFLPANARPRRHGKS